MFDSISETVRLTSSETAWLCHGACLRYSVMVWASPGLPCRRSRQPLPERRGDRARILERGHVPGALDRDVPRARDARGELLLQRGRADCVVGAREHE